MRKINEDNALALLAGADFYAHARIPRKFSRQGVSGSEGFEVN
jgi:uncharacterized phage infection (PIP) family protein YhgE